MDVRPRLLSTCMLSFPNQELRLRLGFVQISITRWGHETRKSSTHSPCVPIPSAPSRQVSVQVPEISWNNPIKMHRLVHSTSSADALFPSIFRKNLWLLYRLLDRRHTHIAYPGVDGLCKQKRINSYRTIIDFNILCSMHQRRDLLRKISLNLSKFIVIQIHIHIHMVKLEAQPTDLKIQIMVPINKYQQWYILISSESIAKSVSQATKKKKKRNRNGTCFSAIRYQGIWNHIKTWMSFPHAWADFTV